MVIQCPWFLPQHGHDFHTCTTLLEACEETDEERHDAEASVLHHLSLTHDRLRGHISYGGVVVDGVFLTFEQLAELVQTYEGFQFDLKILDSSDDLG